MLPGLFIQPRQSNKEGKQMAKNAKRKLHKNIQVAFQRLVSHGRVLCRQSSDTEEAERGGGYIYFAKANNAPIPPSSAKFLIENGLAVPYSDGLFADTAQSFEAVDSAEFHAFREKYEALADA